MKKVQALFFCLIMMTMSLSGCFGNDDGTDQEITDVVPVIGVYISLQHLVDLPECSIDTNGRLYYLEFENEFRVCKFNTAISNSRWDVIEINGAPGADGQEEL